MEHLEYDTIYHEHFSYFSLHSIRAIFGAQGLDLVDVQELESHGGSLRVFLRHAEAGDGPSAAVDEVLAREDAQGLRDPASYARFAEGVRESKRALLDLLIGLRREGKQVVGYGAPGEGEHAAELLRDPHRLPRLHGRPEPVQAGQAHPGDAHPDPSAGEDRGDAAGRDRDPAVESRARDLASSSRTRRSGAPAWSCRSRSRSTSTSRTGLDAPADVGLTSGGRGEG